MRAQVRISRKRILESAAKVFEMYGTSRAVLEIEYFGEVGAPSPIQTQLLAQALSSCIIWNWVCI